eukprot:jgi/Undpi1/488/HiC_scaffold_10.g03954.m1
MEEDDLYGDLDTSADALKIKGLENELANSESLARSLGEKLSATQEKENKLREENEQLAKNISCLFNTARAEIARKEKWIDQLRQQLQNAEDKIRRDRARR